MFEYIGEEFRGAVLGDARRGARLGEALSREPSGSFPETVGSEGQLEALYRRLNNDAVASSVLAPHRQMTAARCRALKDVLVLHDNTTSFEFSGVRTGLGRLHTSSARQGFFFHASFAVSPARDPLGIVAAETWARIAPIRGRANKRTLRGDPTRESLRWSRGVAAAERTVSRPGHPVHVMDREGDNYDLFSYLHEESIRHVIRLAHNRNLVGTSLKLKDRARGAHHCFTGRCSSPCDRGCES